MHYYLFLYRNGIQNHQNNWEESTTTMNINYGPPPILAAAPPTGLPPGIPTIRGRGQMNNFGGQQQYRQYQQQQQQQQQQQPQQQQQQNMFPVGRGVYGGGWGSPSHNPMPPNMNPGGWGMGGGGGGGGGGHRGGRVGGMGSMGGQRNKIFGAYGHQGSQYKVKVTIKLFFCFFFNYKNSHHVTKLEIVLDD